ncbi:MAG TPA: cytochrome c [Thermoanaerobaculia bacterium]|nr:cytochrome c [Thermoanaerobaculia bacterium]
MKTVVTVVLVLLVVALAAVGFIYSGIYDVAAGTPDTGLIQWALETTQHRSVHRRAEQVKAPPLNDPDLIRTGLIEYHEMCVVCHGAPGVPISPAGQGLNPSPPLLADESTRGEAGELFWITKNGIKMTGMPAFGVTHSDEEIWAIVAFMKRMGDLSPEEYQKMVVEAGIPE